MHKIVPQGLPADVFRVLLLHGPVAFSFPEEEVIDYIIRERRFVSVRAVVFVRADKCRVWTTNLA